MVKNKYTHSSSYRYFMLLNVDVDALLPIPRKVCIKPIPTKSCQKREPFFGKFTLSYFIVPYQKPIIQWIHSETDCFDVYKIGFIFWACTLFLEMRNIVHDIVHWKKKFTKSIRMNKQQKIVAQNSNMRSFESGMWESKNSLIGNT